MLEELGFADVREIVNGMSEPNIVRDNNQHVQLRGGLEFGSFALKCNVCISATSADALARRIPQTQIGNFLALA